MTFDQNLDRVLVRYEELQALMSAEPVPLAEEFAQLSKEFSELGPLVIAINELRGVQAELEGVVMMLGDDDSEMRTMAEEEQRGLQAKLPDLARQVQLMLLPKDSADSKNAILEVRAGTGGDEAGLFASDLFRMYQRYAEGKKWKFEVMGISETGIGVPLDPKNPLTFFKFFII